MSMKLIIPLLLISSVVFAEDKPLKISEICTNLKVDLKQFNKQNASDIRNTIQTNINLFNDLSDKVDRAKSYDEVFPEIVSTIDKVAKNYTKIASQKDMIARSLSKQIEAVKAEGDRTDSIINLLEYGIRANEAKAAMEKIDYRKAALEATIKFQKEELNVWTKFKYDINFGDLNKKMIDAKGGIYRFVDILESNAMVYNQASKTLRAIQDYRMATKTINDILEVNALGDQLVESWSKLSLMVDDAVSKVENVESNLYDSTGVDSSKVLK